MMKPYTIENPTPKGGKKGRGGKHSLIVKTENDIVHNGKSIAVGLLFGDRENLRVRA